MSKQALIVANWKMNGSTAMVAQLCPQIAKACEEIENAYVVLCPPNVLLSSVKQFTGDQLALGAQDVDHHENGAFTGQVSAQMLHDIGCQYVIIGHSERRNMYHENDTLIAQKITRAIEAGLYPILCVGETLAEREQDLTLQVITKQIDAALSSLNEQQLAQVTIAYEPVWAIGTGKAASAEQAQQVHAQIRAHLSDHFASCIHNAHILYGGSMNAENAASLLAMPDIDGGLIGGASLKAEQFIKICQSA